MRIGSSVTGNNSINNLVGTGSNKHVVGLDAVISLFSSSCPIVVKHSRFSLGAMNEAEVLDAVHQWFNHNVMKRREYFLYGNKTKIMTLFTI